MKEIKRDIYLEKLINRKENGLIKIITGIRRSGKSYLLDSFKISDGQYVSQGQVIATSGNSGSSRAARGSPLRVGGRGSFRQRVGRASTVPRGRIPRCVGAHPRGGVRRWLRPIVRPTSVPGVGDRRRRPHIP